MLKNLIERRFQVTKRGSKISTEVMAGLTLFFTSVYIVFLNPNMMVGMDIIDSQLQTSLVIAMCIGAGLSTLIAGIIANLPIVQASSISLGSLFIFTISLKYGYSWQAGFAMMFLSGLVFIALTLTKVREKLLNSIPKELKTAISVGIGFFIGAIGFQTINGSSIISDATLLFVSPIFLATMVGLIIIIVLTILKVRFALFISLISVTLGCVLFAIVDEQAAQNLRITRELDFSLNYDVFGQFIYGFQHLFGANGPGEAQGDLFKHFVVFITVMLSILLINIFDTIGSLIGIIKHGNFFDQNQKPLGVNQALLADAIGTTMGGIFCYTPITTFAESNVAVSAGAKTGLAAVVTGLLFFIFIPLAPIGGWISPAATAPIMMFVGASIMQHVVEIDWRQPIKCLPAFLTILVIMLTKDIFAGISIGSLMTTVVALGFYIATKFGRITYEQYKEYYPEPFKPIFYVFCVLFLAYYCLAHSFY